ncbi:MAG: flagellar hook-basal body complex protein FliE [Phycisphaerales bacterium]|nr:flagellar hook-basal body complex protein FliE [Phycisphaerales bacterium]
MADPLGLLGGGGMRQQGLADALRAGGTGVAGAKPAVDANGDTFKDVLLKSIDQVNQLQGEAASAQEDIASGRSTDIESVVLATQKADTAFRALLAVRNKVTAAYEELKQVRI